MFDPIDHGFLQIVCSFSHSQEDLLTKCAKDHSAAIERKFLPRPRLIEQTNKEANNEQINVARARVL
jgi:hypothetical protein